MPSGSIDRVAAETAVDNLGFLADLYHLAATATTSTGPSPRYADRVGHVQIADAPGRDEPGTGELDLASHLDGSPTAGYDGWVGLEYKPSGASADSFGWLPRASRRAAPDRPHASTLDRMIA